MLAERRDIFRYGDTHPILELNHRVLCGVTPERRNEYRDHIAETEAWFYDRPGAGIGALIDWYQRNRTSQANALAAGVLVQTVSLPQLFIEGNRRTGTLLASYVLARGGLPPLVVNETSWPRYAELVDRCATIDRGGLVGAVAISRITHQVATFIAEVSDPRFLGYEGLGGDTGAGALALGCRTPRGDVSRRLSSKLHAPGFYQLVEAIRRVRDGGRMMDDKSGEDSGGLDWLEAELADALDEDYELELDEPALSEEIRKIYQQSASALDRPRTTISARCCGCSPS